MAEEIAKENLTNLFAEITSSGMLIGTGSFGCLYQCEWRQCRVASKTFRSKECLERQMAHLIRHRHPNVILVLDIGYNLDAYQIIVEYADGGNLETFLHGDSKPYYSRAQGLYWARQCAEAVAFLHSKGLKQFDLEPSKLLLCSNQNRLKISCFKYQPESIMDMVVNIDNCAYIAPEYIAEKPYTQKADVYIWSIVLWEILARKKAFNEYFKKSFFEILFLAGHGERPPINAVWPKCFKELLSICWNQDPDKRPAMQAVVDTVNIMFLPFYADNKTMDDDWENNKFSQCLGQK